MYRRLIGYFEEFWLKVTNSSVSTFLKSGDDPAIKPAAIAMRPDSRGYCSTTWEASIKFGDSLSVDALFLSPPLFVKEFTITKRSPEITIANRPEINAAMYGFMSVFRYKNEDQTRKPRPIIINTLETKSTAAKITSRVITPRIYSFPGFNALVIIVPKVLKMFYLRSNSFPRKSPTTNAIRRL